MNTYDYYTKTINKYVNSVSKELSMLGCFVLGSYARKEIGPFSDVDLYIVTRESIKIKTDWLLFEGIFFSIKYYTLDSLTQEINFNPKTFVEYSKTFEYVDVLIDTNNTIHNLIANAIKNAQEIKNNKDSFIKTISYEFSSNSEEICKVANAIARKDLIDFNMVILFATIGINNCLQMANKVQLRTENSYLHQSYEMKHKPDHFESDIKVLLRFELVSIKIIIQSLIRFYKESFSMLRNLNLLTEKTITDVLFFKITF